MDGVEIRFKDDEVEKEREEEDKKINRKRKLIERKAHSKNNIKNKDSEIHDDTNQENEV